LPVTAFSSVAFTAFDTVGRQEEHPTCKNVSDGVLAWLSVCSAMQMIHIQYIMHMVQLMPLPPRHFLFH